MAGPIMTSHPTGARRKTTRRRPTQKRRPAGRRPASRGRAKRTRRTKKGWDPKRWWPVLVVAAAVLVGVAWDSENKGVPPVPGHCTVAGLSMTLTSEQVANAATIAQVGRDRGLSERAVVIALATAQQESRLRNLDYGDRDSLGLFQQRPSAGWGTEAEVQDPVYAAGKFYDHLVQVPDWETRDLTTVADAVQRSAFPLAYRKWTVFAQSLATALQSTDNSAFICA